MQTCKEEITYLTSGKIWVLCETFNKIRSISGEKPEKCLECGKDFRLKAELKRHMLSHSDPQLKCPYCPKLYRTTTELKVLSHYSPFSV